jgi:hypothetical protein
MAPSKVLREKKVFKRGLGAGATGYAVASYGGGEGLVPIVLLGEA